MSIVSSCAVCLPFRHEARQQGHVVPKLAVEMLDTVLVQKYGKQAPVASLAARFQACAYP